MEDWNVCERKQIAYALMVPASRLTKTLATLLLALLPLPAFAQSITVTPANSTVAIGQQVQFKAFDSTGADISSKVTWSSTDNSVAIVGAATGIAVGMAQGTITVVATPAAGLVLPPPTPNPFAFALTPNSLAFPAWQIGAALPVTQSLVIDNVGPAGTHTDWTSTAPAWLTITPSSGLSKTPVVIGVKAAAAGSYSGSIVLSSPEAPSVNIPVTWTVTAGGVVPPPPPPPQNNFTFALTPTSLAFPSWQIGTPLPAALPLVIDNVGPNGTHTDWTSTTPTWLTITPSSGLSKTAVLIGVKAVAAGTYSGSIVLSSPEAPSVNIPVTWTVKAAAAAVTITCLWDSVALQNNCVIKNVPSGSSVQVQVMPSGPTATATRP